MKYGYIRKTSPWLGAILDQVKVRTFSMASMSFRRSLNEQMWDGEGPSSRANDWGATSTRRDQFQEARAHDEKELRLEFASCITWYDVAGCISSWYLQLQLFTPSLLLQRNLYHHSDRVRTFVRDLGIYWNTKIYSTFDSHLNSIDSSKGVAEIPIQVSRPPSLIVEMRTKHLYGPLFLFGIPRT